MTETGGFHKGHLCDINDFLMSFKICRYFSSAGRCVRSAMVVGSIPNEPVLIKSSVGCLDLRCLPNVNVKRTLQGSIINNSHV